MDHTPLVAALWYGLLSLVLLFAFSSLGYEVQRAFNAATQADDDEAWSVARATLHVNGAVMVVVSAIVAGLCVSLAVTEENWRMFFSLSSFATGAYWVYTQRTEQRLVAFYERARIYPKFRER